MIWAILAWVCAALAVIAGAWLLADGTDVVSAVVCFISAATCLMAGFTFYETRSW